MKKSQILFLLVPHPPDILLQGSFLLLDGLNVRISEDDRDAEASGLGQSVSLQTKTVFLGILGSKLNFSSLSKILVLQLVQALLQCLVVKVSRLESKAAADSLIFERQNLVICIR